MQSYIKSHRDVMYRPDRCSKCFKHPNSVGCRVRPEKGDYFGLGGDSLRWNISGPECTPYSPMGKRSGSSHAAMESWHTWVNGIFDTSAYDIVSVENSESMPESIISSEVGRGWYFIPLVTDVLKDTAITRARRGGVEDAQPTPL
eukprot:12790830-Alexandrium_andersonii.AAC.1